MTIAQLKSWLKESEQEEVKDHLSQLKSDPRIGVQRIITQWEQKEELLQQRVQHWHMLNQEEKKLQGKGFSYIAGVDEVGRGPLAGPLVAAAVILPRDFVLFGINDSKQLKKEEREEYDIQIRKQAIAYSITYIEAKEVDRINIYQATIKAMSQALLELATQPEFALIDAMKLPISIPYKSIIKGDTKSASIAAASIIAKVSRDEWMAEMSQLYPQYGFERNKGYGTKEHLQAIESHGPTPIHRRSFLTKQLNVSI